MFQLLLLRSPCFPSFHKSTGLTFKLSNQYAWQGLSVWASYEDKVGCWRDGLLIC